MSIGGIGPPMRYYPAVGLRRLRHYLAVRLRGYPNYGDLATAADIILDQQAANGFSAGSHFTGVWARDLAFAAPGIVSVGHGDTLRRVAHHMVAGIEDIFFTDFYANYHVATPAEGVDTFPSLVLILDAVGDLRAHACDLARLAALHREKFFDEDRYLITGRGSGWWDSATEPRVAYNTSMLAAGAARLERAGVETTYTGASNALQSGMNEALWNGEYYDERPGSSVLSADANVIPLYFSLVDQAKADTIVSALESLVTQYGMRMRAQPFTRDEVHWPFSFHTDYHSCIWPWNSFMCAIGFSAYGYHARADAEVERIEATLRKFGNFLEVLTEDGTPYIKRGYASASDFTVAAALWREYLDR